MHLVLTGLNFSFMHFDFRPFSLIAQCPQKVEWDQAEGIIVVPNWPTQPWFSKLMQLLTETPWIILKSKTTVQLPWEVHRVHTVSGNLTKYKEYLQQQQVLQTQFWKTTVYQSHINRWKTYCGKRQIDFIRTLIVLDFFVRLYENGATVQTTVQ